MSSTVVGEGGVSARDARQERLKVLFFLPGIAYYRLFESLLATLLAPGHQVLVAFDHRSGGLPAEDAALLEELRRRYPAFDHRQLPARTGLWRIPTSGIRRTLDYLRYREPEYADAEELRAQARDRVPRVMRALLFLPPFRWAVGRRMLGGLLRRVDAGAPLPGAVKSFVSEQAPDVVLVSPLVEFGSAQADYLRAAEAARIPSVLVAASEDDLTSKGAIRDTPTLTVTGSEARIDEVARLQGLPRERIVAVGAERVNGHRPPAPPGTLQAIERAAGMEVVRRREGRLVRPLLWLLTPLVAILVALLRPRATGRAAVRALRRLPGRISKRTRTMRRATVARRAERSKARARATKEQKRGRADEFKQAKLQRAREKEQGRARAVAAKQEKRVRAQAAKQARKRGPDAAKPDEVAGE